MGQSIESAELSPLRSERATGQAPFYDRLRGLASFTVRIRPCNTREPPFKAFSASAECSNSTNANPRGFLVIGRRVRLHLPPVRTG